MQNPSIFVDDLVFAEAPRWYDDRLWFSDMHGGTVYAASADGACERIVDVPRHPSGLGFMPDGSLLVVSMEDRKVLRWRDGETAVHADLAGHYARGHLNDMSVDAIGRAYVGQFGSDTYGGEPMQATSLILVEPDGSHRTVAQDLMMPNGMAISADGTALYVAESYRSRITRFGVEPDGSLGERSVFAQLEVRPDGICLDAAGCIWFGSAMYPEGGIFRVAQGGEVLEAIRSEGWRGIACALGGPGRDTLYLIEALRTSPSKIAGRGNSRIRAVPAPAPGIGFP